MHSLKKFLTWRKIFAVSCLVYLVWVVGVSNSNFYMVHREYRWAEMRVQPKWIAKTARQELVDQCRQKAIWSGSRLHASDKDSDPCLSWPPSTVAERQQVVKERLVQERNLAIRKLVLFYVSFGFFFLVMPPAFLYLFLVFVSWLFRNITVVR